MMLKIKKYIFKRKYLIVRLREENNQLKDNLANKRKLLKTISENLVKTVAQFNIISEKKDRASKKIAELVNIGKQYDRRRNEVIKRLESKMPDDIISGRFEDYKYWIAEPFIVDQYDEHKKINDNITFIDSFSAYRGIAKVLEDEQEGKG